MPTPNHYFISRNGIITGPFPWIRLENMASAGQLQMGDMLSQDKQHWLPAQNLFPRIARMANPKVLQRTSLEIDEVPPEPVEEEPAIDFSMPQPEPTKTDPPWLFSRLFLAFGNAQEHLPTIAQRNAPLAAIALLYALGASLIPTCLFQSAYPQTHGCLISASFTLILILVTEIIALACTSSCKPLGEKNNWGLSLATTWILLALDATAIGASLCVLHGLQCHAMAAKITVATMLLLLVTLKAAMAAQIFRTLARLQNASDSTGNLCWILWNTGTILAFSLFHFLYLKFP